MSGLVDRVRGALRVHQPLDPATLLDRIAALDRFLGSVEGHLPDARLVGTRTVVERAGARLRLSRAHTVVALAGATGCGKSSLFNALTTLNLSPVGVRRPTTGATHACVWGELADAEELLDWIGVLPRYRFTRESALDGDDEETLRGLVLLDLPDLDSVERTHRAEVDRLLGLVDLVVWVTDPQKYADRVVHRAYLREFGRHKDVTVVLLNQADLLTAADADRLLADLRRLLDLDGLGGVPAIATSAVDPAGQAQLREQLERTVAERQAALRRLDADVSAVVEDLAPLVAAEPPGDPVDRTGVRRLADTLARTAGVPAVAEATERAYRHRAHAAIGWPLMRWLGKLRADPLRRLHLPADRTDPPAPLGATSVPEPDAATRSAAALAVRAVAERASAGLPEPWPAAVTAASRSRLDDLPDALDRAVAGTDLGMRRRPLWWWLVGTVQWLVTLAALGGLGWLLLGYGVRAIGLPALEYPKVGEAPWPSLLLIGGLLVGLVLAVSTRPLVAWAAHRARIRAGARLRAAVAAVGEQYVVAPVLSVTDSYARAREALAAARRPG